MVARRGGKNKRKQVKQKRSFLSARARAFFRGVDEWKSWRSNSLTFPRERAIIKAAPWWGGGVVEWGGVLSGLALISGGCPAAAVLRRSSTQAHSTSSLFTRVIRRTVFFNKEERGGVLIRSPTRSAKVNRCLNCSDKPTKTVGTGLSFLGCGDLWFFRHQNFNSDQ